MNATIFKYALLLAIVVAARGAGAWYFLAPPKTTPGEVPVLQEPGIIKGTTSYPSDFNPAQRVCAQSVTDSSYERCADVPEQEGTVVPTFSIKVAPGTYQVYAFLKDPSELGLDESRRAYWTEFVRCGMTTDCTDHARLDVVVGAAAAVVDIRPQDWYQ